MNLISLTPSRQIDECNAHSMELYAPTGKVWLFLVISTTVGELEVEEGLGTPWCNRNLYEHVCRTAVSEM